MEITAPGKLYALIVAMILLGGMIIVAMIKGQAAPDQTWLILSSIIGYLVGNGVGAKTGQPTAPVIGPKTDS